MPFLLLDPSAPPDASFRNLTALTVMAKAPRPGRVKTRLNPPLTPEQCAAINTAFLRDTTADLQHVAETSALALGVVSYTPVGDEFLFEGLLPNGYALVPQRGDGFGERLLTTAEDLFRCGFGSVCLIDSDSPTVPTAVFEHAVRTLHDGDETTVVLGPSDDGGYYLIGMNRPHAAVFERITWSTGAVLAETVARIHEAGLTLHLLPTWYDVDDAATLAVLRAELLDGVAPHFAETTGRFAGIPGCAAGNTGYAAPVTREFLRTLVPGA